MDQRELIERARQGDHDAFAALVDGAIRRLDAAARLILRDSDLAQDAVQDALIRAWRNLPGLWSINQDDLSAANEPAPPFPTPDAKRLD